MFQQPEYLPCLEIESLSQDRGEMTYCIDIDGKIYYYSQLNVIGNIIIYHTDFGNIMVAMAEWLGTSL